MLVVTVVLLLNSVHSSAQCDLGCVTGPLTIAIGETGVTKLYPSYFIAFKSPTCEENDTLNIIQEGSDIVNCDMVGGSYTVQITNVASGNFCTCEIIVEDNLAPELTCPDDITIHCDQLYTDVSLTGTATSSDNCSYSLVYEDDSSDLNECGFGVISRIWKTIDPSGHYKQCTQNITVIDTIPPVISFPANVTIHCGQDDQDLNLTGSPSYSDNCGSLDDSFTDLAYELCGPGTKRILRTWEVVDFCDINGPYGIKRLVQTITIIDTIAPTFLCFTRDTFATNLINSYRSFVVPALREVSDNCSQYVVDSLVFNSVGDTLIIVDTIVDLPIGLNRIKYFVTDDCGNRDSCSYEVFIEDKSDPFLVCFPTVNISLSTDSTIIALEAFYIDATDNVSPDSLLTFSLNYLGTDYEFLPLTCADAGDQFKSALLRVEDENGNFNQCEVVFQVFDIFKPQINCPEDITLDCGQDLNDLEGPTIYENCDYSYWFEDDLSGLNDCGLGTVIRKWIIEDESKNSDSCLQYITFISDFVPTFTEPVDITIECGDNEHPSFTGEPIFNDDCSQLVRAYYDQPFLGGGLGVVKVIVRTFEVVDDCNNSFLSFFEQIITVVDNSLPQLNSTVQAKYYVPHGQCEKELNFDIIVSDPCLLSLDLSHDGQIGSIDDNGIFSGIFPLGAYSFSISVNDGYGNESDLAINFEVIDSIAPISLCRTGLSISLGIDNLITPDALLFDAGSNDNCTPEANLFYEISPSIFNCYDQGLNEVIFTVKDLSGNEAVCITSLLILDTDQLCPKTDFKVEGQVLDGNYNVIENIAVKAVIEQDTFITYTNEEGNYIFEKLAASSEVELFPSFEGELKKGISLLDVILLRQHTLELRTFESTTEYLAADVNLSGSLTNLDMLLIKASILRTIDYLPSRRTVRSLPYYKEFSAAEDALAVTNKEEHIILDNLSSDTKHLDFVITKIGDVNTSAFDLYSSERSSCDSNFYFRTRAREINRGEDLSIDLISNLNIDLFGVGFVMEFDTDMLEFVELEDVSGLGLLSGSNYNYIDTDGRLIVAWDANPPHSFVPGQVILTIRLKSKENFLWPNYVDLKSSEIADSNFDVYDVCSDAITDVKESRAVSPSIIVSPNPVSDILNIDLSRMNLDKNRNKMFVYNFSGQLMDVIGVNDNTSVIPYNTDNLAPGLYYLVLKLDRKGGVYQKHFIKF